MPKPYGQKTILFQVEDNWLDVLGAMNRLFEAGRENDPDFPLHTGTIGTWGTGVKSDNRTIFSIRAPRGRKAEVAPLRDAIKKAAAADPENLAAAIIAATPKIIKSFRP